MRISWKRLIKYNCTWRGVISVRFFRCSLSEWGKLQELVWRERNPNTDGMTLTREGLLWEESLVFANYPLDDKMWINIANVFLDLRKSPHFEGANLSVHRCAFKVSKTFPPSDLLKLVAKRTHRKPPFNPKPRSLYSSAAIILPRNNTQRTAQQKTERTMARDFYCEKRQIS